MGDPNIEQRAGEALELWLTDKEYRASPLAFTIKVFQLVDVMRADEEEGRADFKIVSRALEMLLELNDNHKVSAFANKPARAITQTSNVADFKRRMMSCLRRLR